MPAETPHNYLRRLPPECYRGRAYVHWSMTIDQRRTGWLVPTFYYKFREILTHTALRYGLACPIYCCMPDHLHLLWIGIAGTCDQRNAARFFRRQLNTPLQRMGFELQSQPYDHVLRGDEKLEAAFEAVAEYIARNPERAGLVAVDEYPTYPFTGVWCRDIRICRRGRTAIGSDSGSCTRDCANTGCWSGTPECRSRVRGP
jgi:putative transposase